MDIDEILDEDFEEGSDDADNDFQYLNDPSSTQPSSGPPSTPNSCTSSPPVNSEDPVSSFYSQNGNTLVFSSGKPYGTKRGPGRPRKEYYPGMRGAIRDARAMFKKSRGGILKGVPRKKMLGKDERNILFSLSQESGFLPLPSKSPTDFLNNITESNISDMSDKTLQVMEEPPYFSEKWPGKVCALCNLGERSQLGQGEMLRMEISEEDQNLYCTYSPNSEDKELYTNDMNTNSSTFPQFSNRRQKGLNKCKNPVITSEYVDELEKVGHFESTELSQIQDCNYYYVHRSCVTWSLGIIRDQSGSLGKVTSVVSQSLRRKCTYCNHYGASIACKMACPKFFHFPCVAASGGFQTIQTYVSFCKEHLGQVPIICTDDISCRSCCGLGDVSNLVMCSICGDHYHGTCIGLPQLPGVRAGWQCVSCHKCQICRVPDTNEGRSLGCEQCHKIYHANCLRPIMSSIPKYGWKCRRCRVCSDCGSRTPGAGTSSRWHAHYTVCDSCYQQRNKGFSCPICHRAYRAAAYREMVKCSLCNKFVHSTCDSEADLAVYHARKENNPDYDYVCPPCKTLIQSGRLNQSLVRRNSHFDDDIMQNSQDSVCPEEFDSLELFDRNADFGLGKGKPYHAIKIPKKRIGLSFGQTNKTKGKLGFPKRSRLSDFGRKRGPKSKMRGIFGVPGLGLQRPTAESYKNDDEPGIENRLVLCSAKDKFILKQDICVMCGAIGTDHEGCLISCTQCGQCYHPYCVNVKVTKVILKKGWRCLDCTVCEGCGQKNDEARLILCDECDISFHIYCMDPPLEFVPQGNWKCKWCAICQKCGRSSAGKNSTWKNSYSECGPCASQASCAVCVESYSDGELIIQCMHCERWLHCKCDMIKNEEEAEKCDDEGYVCILCRPKDVLPPHLVPPKKIPPVPKPWQNPSKVEDVTEAIILHGLEGSHFVDGVCLSEHGLSSIKSQQMEYIRKKRKQKAIQESSINNKDAEILAAIESVVAGSGVIESCIEDSKVVELLDPKEEAEIYKDGMVWERSDGSPPEGFALCTNEQGVVVLRKKRQRNLQKLGIGGFNVRNRTMKKDGGYKDEYEDHGDSTGLYLGSNENIPNDKKKKPMRKQRQKSKLTETYPAYLQEAFFGKGLLDTIKTNFESESSDDDAKSNVSEDKIVKLSPEELKMLESMKNEHKNIPSTTVKENNNYADLKSLKTKIPVSAVSNPPSQCDDDNDKSDAVIEYKDIIHTHDLLDSDLVNSIINDSEDLVKNSGLGVQYDSVVSRKDDLPDILGPNFNLDSIEINSKDVEEIFQGVINPEPKQYPMIKQENPVISLSNTAFPKANTDLQYVSNGVMEDVKPPIGISNYLSIQQTFSNNDIKGIDQVHSTSVTATQSYISPNDQTTNSNSPMTFTNNSIQSVWSSNSQSPRQNTDFSGNQTEESMVSTPTTQSGAIKSTERMRRDEELGEMATISAVLYANTNHPELKLDFPNWSDRYKQIYKKWRALSNEKKAPFLQQARDNRTALRMKKNQQAADIDKDKNPTDSLGTDSGDLDMTTDNNDEDSTSRLSSCSSSNVENEKTPTFEIRSEIDESDSVVSNKNDLKVDENKAESRTNSHPTGIAVRYKLNLIKEPIQQNKIVETAKETSPIKRNTFPKFYISANMNGPAPNVTVNANGAFNTNSKSVLHTYCSSRPITNHFLVMNKNPQRLSVDLPTVTNAVQKEKQVLIKNVLNEALLDDARSKFQVGNKKILHINSSDLLDVNGKKTNATTAIGSIYLDQNIRVLTPSEIMKTLPIIPGQDSSSTPSTVKDYTNRIISGCSLDQEKITSQQKSLKEQEQERQWKQLQATRAKEQQLQQFSPQVSGQTSPSIIPCSSTPIFMADQTIALEKRSPYSSIPGTPRPQFNTDVIQPTVYATHLDTYQAPNLQLMTTSVQEKLCAVKQQENNKQLRDLLQRPEGITGLVGNPNTVLNVSTPGTLQLPTRWNTSDESTLNTQNSQFGSTFREPFPVTIQGRNSKLLNSPSAVRLPVSAAGTIGNLNQQFNPNKMNIGLEKQCKVESDQSTEIANQKVNIIAGKGGMQTKMKIKENISKVINAVGTEIPDNVTAELEKFEQEENVAIGEVEGVGDILGGLGEDDDDELLKSLTAEMGADFNILEYADPELDALTGGDNQNLLDKLDFDEGDPEERQKKSAAENKFAVQRNENMAVDRQSIIQPMQNQINIGQIPPRYNNVIVQPNNICKMPPRPTLAPPPPPYPGPPPPYPANTQNVRQQEQPLLLEDLLEQEKREQQQQLTSSIVTGQLIDKKTFVKVDNMHRGTPTLVNNWRKNTVEIMQNSNNMMMNMEPKIKKEIINPPVLNFNFQLAPPQPPDNIITEQDRVMQINYEQWLNSQNLALENQLKHFEDKVSKLRKIRKSLNSKQRLMKKSGGELLPQDASQLAQITAEQPGFQKQLDNARKQSRQHALLLQDYKSKHLSKMQMPSPNIPSPAQMTPLSPMLSPSTNSQPSMLMRTSPSPLSVHMLQSTRSPLQSPSPLLSHSPGGISQSPVHQSNANASPYSTMQTSPRIGTPHSQMDENSFSPSATMSSPSSLPGRHASPAPRITSPQHRINIQQLPTRIATSPGHSYNSIMPSQSSKFSAPQTHQDRMRIQIGQQQHLHQTQLGLDNQQQQQMVSPIQMHNFQQSPEILQTQRTMHFLQQRQIQRQQVNQNIINQAMNKPKNQPVSSPSHMITSPSSPLLQYPVQQNPNRNIVDTFSVLNSPDQQYMQQCRDTMTPTPDMKNFNRNNQDNNGGGGGGLSSLTSSFLPVCGGSSKFGKIRLGLFGGSPMWNLSNMNQKISLEKAKSGEISSIDLEKGSDVIVKDKSSDSNVNLADGSGTSSRLVKSDDHEIVTIDSSPDEKQRIIDYDDFQDKGFVAAEVSLNSVAQNIVDNDMTVIESFASSELADIVSSPLESEVAEEYVLFSSDVVDYADSDDSLKQNIIPQSDDGTKKIDRNFEKDFETPKTEMKSEMAESSLNLESKSDLSNQDNAIVIKEEQAASHKNTHDLNNFTTSQDFEAMIDSKTTKEDVKLKTTVGTTTINTVNAVITKPLQITHGVTSSLMTLNRIPITSVQCSVLTGTSTQTTNATTLRVTPKKIVGDVTQTTARVSFGNTTISVPLLKNMTLNTPHIISSDKQNKVPTNITLTKQPTIVNVRGTKLNPGTIVSLSSLQLKPSANTKIVQATVVGKKLQLPHTTVENLTKHNLIHTLSYPKLSTLTVLQDMALPTKIFEDEPMSPESSAEQEELDSISKQAETVDLAKNIVINKIVENDSRKELPAGPIEEVKKINAAESSQKEDAQKLQTRSISLVPQLSPLSQPTEMTTNMANVSQQLRTIMSNLNSNQNSNQNDSKTLAENDLKKDQQQRIVFESKVEKPLHQQLQAEEHKEIKAVIQNTDLIGAKTTTTNSNKVTLYLTNASGSTQIADKFQASTNSGDDKLQIKKTKVVVPTSILSTRLPSTIVMTTISSSTNTTQLSDSIAVVQSNHEGTKKIIKPLLAHISSSHLKRSKSTDDGIERDREIPAQITGVKRYSLEVVPSKTDGPENTEENANQSQNQAKSHIQIQTTRADQSLNGCKISNVITQPSKQDDSQNVLLKQLLQNSTNTNNTPSSSQVLPGRKVPGLRAPSLGVVSSLEAQLARPVIPPVPANPPTILQSTPSHSNLKVSLDLHKSDMQDDNNKKPLQIISRETSFVSNPIAKNISKVGDNTSVLEKPAVAQTTYELTTKNTLTVKNEQKPMNIHRTNCESTLIEQKIIKTEIDDSLKLSLNESFDTSKSDSNESPSLKRPNSIPLSFASSMDTSEDQEHSAKDDKSKSADLDSSAELKKKKKREYQKNRRQMQLLNKEVPFTKKRSRKLSKLDEDYDNFIDNLMQQLRQMPSLQVLEPLLSRNYGICPPYGAGDLSKLGNMKENSVASEMLQGGFGSATSANITDFYNTKPFGVLDMSQESPSTTIHNEFYDQEFPPIKFESDFDQMNKMDYSFKDRDIDTPESIVTSSSPECIAWEPVSPFPGLRVISEDDDEEHPYDRMSPVVPVIAPIPIKLQTGIDLSIDKRLHDNNKENSLCNEWKSRNTQQNTPAKDPNVTVTLTLTSSAAEDIMGVLRDLANILHIPAPTSYQIVERTTTPPSQKLGLYRTKGKDGKEGDPIDIQTILNGAAKFCRHCDVVILNTIIRAKASEFPLLTSNELLNNSDDLYFCSKSCYKQFKWRPTNIIDDNYHLDSKANITLDNNLNRFDHFTDDSKAIKLEHAPKNSRKCSSSGLDDNNYHKNKMMKSMSNESSSDNYSQRSNEKTKSSETAQKSSRYRYFSHNTFASPLKYKKSTEKEITEMLFRMNITVAPVNKMPDDTRQCIFCNQIGDGVADGPSRLLNYDVDKWVHLNCALWSDGVYETENGALMNLEAALQVSLNQPCTLCHQLGATIKCFKARCGNVYHLSCAIKDNCIFYKNKSTHCMAHILKNEKENELTTLSVQRRVYVDRDESRQVAAVMHHSDSNNLLRVGSLTFLNIGQLLPHQLQAFHTPNYIYPIGYKIIRFYWSMRKPNKRCRYICSIADVCGRPEFRVIVQEPSEDDIELRDATPKSVWQRILEPLATLRKNCELVQLFPKYVTGEDLFGLTEPAVVRILESLPGIDTLTDYRFKYGRNPLLELPLAINPSGAARAEPKQKQTVGWRKPHTQRSGSSNQRIPLAPTTSIAGEVACPYSKQFVHSKSSQYKKMKQEWRNNVFLARSKIQGLGLYAARDLEKHTMVIEYIGEVIRTEVSELREKQYEARNRGIYMFRLDEDRVVDATLSGGLARYINHSCNPNCVTEIVEVDREYRIIIFAKRRINRGEELSYDYKFDIEDDANKISCMCGAPNCRKWMN